MIFFPVAVLVYFILPPDNNLYRKLWLLICSYYFYMTGGPEYALILLFLTLFTYFSAFFIRGRRPVLVISIAVELAILFFFKYFNFFCDSFNIKTELKILLPIGISFYIFKSLSYVIDVYRGTIEAEKDFIKYALYVSFFPELLAGPISRASSVLPQIDRVQSFDYIRVRHGLLRMLWGFFLKLVIASRLSIMVDLIYSNVNYADAMQLLTAAIAFTIQVYCDFMSYSEIAIGAGEVLGFKLHENFAQPFLSDSLSMVWRRWHMSLMSWFKDYLYIPLGGSRKGKVRKYINILIVFTLSGLWHGAAVTFIMWGFLSGLLQVVGEITLNARNRIAGLFPVKNACTARLHRIWKRLMTFLLFSFTAIFFRAASLDEAMAVITGICTGMNIDCIRNFDPTALGLGSMNLCIALFMILILVVADIIKEKKGDIFSLITSKKWPVRWAVYFFLTLSIIFSANIGAAKFIYFDF